MASQIVQSQDTARFHPTLARLIGYIHQVSTVIGRDENAVSDMILPAADMSLAEVRDMLAPAPSPQ